MAVTMGNICVHLILLGLNTLGQMKRLVKKVLVRFNKRSVKKVPKENRSKDSELVIDEIKKPTIQLDLSPPLETIVEVDSIEEDSSSDFDSNSSASSPQKGSTARNLLASVTATDIEKLIDLDDLESAINQTSQLLKISCSDINKRESQDQSVTVDINDQVVQRAKSNLTTFDHLMLDYSTLCESETTPRRKESSRSHKPRLQCDSDCSDLQV